MLIECHIREEIVNIVLKRKTSKWMWNDSVGVSVINMAWMLYIYIAELYIRFVL